MKRKTVSGIMLIRARRAVNIRKTATSFFLAFILFISLNTVVARAQLWDESSESLELLLWLVVPLLTGFLIGILIGGALRGLLTGAIGAVIFCFIAVLIIYRMGYIVVVTDLSAGTTTELTGYEAFVDAIYSRGGIILGAVAGAVGGWLGKRRRKKPVTQIPEILFFCPQCGRRLSLHAVDVDKFCPYCGKPLGEKMRARTQTCPSCGYENPPYAEKVCIKCGSQLKTEVKPLEKPIPQMKKEKARAPADMSFEELEKKIKFHKSEAWGSALAGVFLFIVGYVLLLLFAPLENPDITKYTSLMLLLGVGIALFGPPYYVFKAIKLKRQTKKLRMEKMSA